MIFVSVELMQRVPYAWLEKEKEEKEKEILDVKVPPLGKRNNYILFSHYDEMHISYSEKLEFRDTPQKSPLQLLFEPCEQHKLLLYKQAEGKDEEFFKEEGQETLLVALVGLKLKRSYFAYALENTQYYKLVKDKMDDLCDLPLGSGLKYQLLHSLGADDLYMLIRGNDPVQILRVVHTLRESEFAVDPLPGKDEEIEKKIILEAHSHIGFYAGLNPDTHRASYKIPKFKFEIQVRTAVPDCVDAIQQGLRKYKFGVYRSGERYDIVACRKINIVKLIQLYQGFLIDWKKKGLSNYILSTNGRFLYYCDAIIVKDKNKGCT